MACVAVALTHGYAPAADAATMYYLDVPALVEASDAVVIGEIVDSRVFVGNYDRITTEWTVDVSSTLVGSPQSTVRFRQWTGELDGMVQHVPGDARITLGETYVLFLRGDAPDGLFLTALAQSSYQVHVHAALSAWEGLDDVPALVRNVLTPAEGDLRPSIRVDSIPMDAPVTRDFTDLGFYDSTDATVTEQPVQVQLLGGLVRAVERAVEGE